MGINTYKGSLAFGINGVIAQFADIRVGAIKPPVDMPPAAAKGNDEDEESASESEDDDPELNGESTDTAVAEAATIDKIDCVSISKRDSRMAYCNKKFNGDSECIKAFATRCCVFEN